MEKNYELFDDQMLEFMVRVRKEMDWLDAKHLFLAPKDIFVFFGRLDQEHKKSAKKLYE